MADESAFTTSWPAPSTLETLKLVHRRGTKFLDLVQHSAVPFVTVDFALSYNQYFSPVALQRMRAQPAIRLHLHFEENRGGRGEAQAHVKLVDSNGRVRHYSHIAAKHCLTLPWFSRVRSLAISGLQDVAAAYCRPFPPMPDLEELCLVVGSVGAAGGMQLSCPRLERFELVFEHANQPPIHAPVTAVEVTGFYHGKISKDASSIELRLPGLDVGETCLTQLAQDFAGVHVGLSLDPYVLPKCT
ncbi:hypothetical protein EXIGLDRAFT_784696 [Exidia glandulosa HHB12029]|uniref:Uncharacterized protein n=1 Tax=Exidia glandulosa HHB12029 TaxID=1314781 RepID=A0A165YYK0_EXIGL|nr:hypothetical protein EXIGLDRAFT_784696 [Exidia glandulosa HHB12029]